MVVIRASGERIVAVYRRLTLLMRKRRRRKRWAFYYLWPKF
jgi:hypothetical protein